MPNEIELKFDVAPGALRQLEASPLFRKREGESAGYVKLVSVYFDTNKYKLRDEGISLRVRYAQGKIFQTIKTGRLTAPVIRQEWEVEIDGDIPDLAQVQGTPLELLATTKLKRKLRPIFETNVRRRAVLREMNGALIELTVDRGRITTGNHSKSIYEVELELKAGEVSDLIDVASQLIGTLPARYNAGSKAELGYALAENRLVEAVHREPIDLDRDATVGDSFEAIGLSCLRHFVRNEGAVLKGDAEGVHQMRVGLRRLRTAISLFKDILQDTETSERKGQLKWLTDEFGSARNYDVFVKASSAALQAPPPRKQAIDDLKSILDGRRANHFNEAKKIVASDHYQKIVFWTVAWLLGGVWKTSSDELQKIRREQCVRDFACRILTKRTRNIGKRIKRLQTLSPQQRHKLRIAIKKLRYATEFFASLFPTSRTKRKGFVNVLEHLQEVLGKINDIGVHTQLATDVIRAKGTDREMTFALGRMTGVEDSEISSLMAAASKAGTRLLKLTPFWK